MQLTSAGILEIVEPLLPTESEEGQNVIVSDVLSLIKSLLP